MVTLDTLDASLHSVKVSDGTNDLLIDGSGHISINDGGNSITVDATQLDIDDLDSATDNVEIQNAAGQALNIDGSGFITANINGTVATVPAAYDTWKATDETVTTTAAQVAATALANRLRMTIQNLGSQDIYLGEANTVTTSTGFKLPKGSSWTEQLGASATIWALTAASTSDIRVAEFAD